MGLSSEITLHCVRWASHLAPGSLYFLIDNLGICDTRLTVFL